MAVELVFARQERPVGLSTLEQVRALKDEAEAAASTAATNAVTAAGPAISAAVQEAAGQAAAAVEGLAIVGISVEGDQLILTRSDGTTLQVTLPTGSIDPIAPSFSELPSLTGGTALGATVTASLGSASGTPSPTLTGTLTRPGEVPETVLDGHTFDIGVADQGGTITLDVTATNVAGSDIATAEIVVPWEPAALFANGEQGAIYDASDLSTIYQDADGTVPAVVGQPVALMRDKTSNNNDARA